MRNTSITKVRTATSIGVAPACREKWIEVTNEYVAQVRTNNKALVLDITPTIDSPTMMATISLNLTTGVPIISNKQRPPISPSMQDNITLIDEVIRS